jgi:hypothetical protein
MNSESVDPIILTAEDADNALKLFPAEETGRAAPDARSADSSRLIERQHHPPIAADVCGEVRPLPARPGSTSHFENWSLAWIHWPFGAARSWHVGVSAALVSAAALALLALTVGRDPSNASTANRSTQAAAGAHAPVVNPNRTPSPAAEAPPSLLGDLTVFFSTLSASAPSAHSTRATPAPRSRSSEINLSRPRDDRQTIDPPVPEIPVAAVVSTSSQASSDPSPAPIDSEASVILLERPVAESGGPAVSIPDVSAIQTVLGRYLAAFMDFDIEAAKAVWPGVNERALSRSFASLDEQQFEMSECDIAVTGPNADASCTGVVRYVPKVGSKTMRVERRRWKFELRNSDSQWFIETVDSR